MAPRSILAPRLAASSMALTGQCAAPERMQEMIDSTVLEGNSSRGSREATRTPLNINLNLSMSPQLGMATGTHLDPHAHVRARDANPSPTDSGRGIFERLFSGRGPKSDVDATWRLEPLHLGRNLAPGEQRSAKATRREPWSARNDLRNMAECKRAPLQGAWNTTGHGAMVEERHLPTGTCDGGLSAPTTIRAAWWVVALGENEHEGNIALGFGGRLENFSLKAWDHPLAPFFFVPLGVVGLAICTDAPSTTSIRPFARVSLCGAMRFTRQPASRTVFALVRPKQYQRVANRPLADNAGRLTSAIRLLPTTCLRDVLAVHLARRESRDRP